MALGYCALDAKAMNACCGLVTTDAYILILFAAWSDYMVVARKWEFRCEKPHTDSTETQKTAVLSLCYDLGWLYGFFVNERGSEIELAIETKKLFLWVLLPTLLVLLRRALVTAAKSTLSFEPTRVLVDAEIRRVFLATRRVS
jgi:hypothetical protein